MSVETPPLERKLIAILAADVEGYSRLMHADEEATLLTLTSHRAIVDSLIAAAGGYISNTAGDSVLAEFASVVESVVCAVEIQRTLAIANEQLPAERRMQFRIGINVGDVMVKDGGVFGDGVNVAARVEALAPAGAICVTRGVRDHVRDRLPYRFEDRGTHTVKNIPRPIHVYLLRDGEAVATEAPAGLVEQPVAPADDTTEVELTFWKSVDGSASPDEYRAYLERYPDGAFAALAKARLDGAAAAPVEPVDRTVELAFWDSVKDSGDPALFAAYLETFPDGAFKAIAEVRIASAP